MCLHWPLRIDNKYSGDSWTPNNVTRIGQAFATKQKPRRSELYSGRGGFVVCIEDRGRALISGRLNRGVISEYTDGVGETILIRFASEIDISVFESRRLKPLNSHAS